VNERDGGVPIEWFIQALQSQLDRAQAAMALKARNLPLTFAVKDISLDLRAHVEVVKSEIRIRPAAPGDAEASTLKFSLTTITRPMIEENTHLATASDEPSLNEALGDSLDEEEQRRLAWAGVQTVSQLRELQQRAGEHVLERVANIPAMRLRNALERASRPMVNTVVPERLNRRELPGINIGPSEDGNEDALLLRIRGHNLMRERAPQVKIGGENVPVLKATEKELLVAPLAHQMGGSIVIETAPGSLAETEFDLLRMRPTVEEMGSNKGSTNGHKGSLA
jgi:hypothetical protein